MIVATPKLIACALPIDIKYAILGAKPQHFEATKYTFKDKLI
jgi:hypothetical protein